MTDLTIYTHAFNDPLLKYWIRHHVTITPRVIVYLDPQAPKEVEDVCRQEGALAWPPLPFTGLDDLTFVMFARSVIHAQTAPDWSAWLDSDEYLFCADWKRTLSAYAARGATALRPGKGWQMVHPALPTTAGQIYSEVTKGHDEPGVAKPCIVRAGMVPLWDVGKHQIAGGDTPAPEIVMAHFRNLGIDRQLAHNAENEARKSARQRANRWGYQTAPEYADGERKVFEERLAKVEEVIFP